MATLRLGAYHLPPAEAGLVRAQIRLLAIGAGDFAWEFAEAAPYDALIVDANSPDIGGALLQRSAKAIGVLANESSPIRDDTDVLCRPLRAEHLEAWLRRVQAKLLGSAKPAIVVASAAHKPRFKLRRWPPAPLLHEDSQRVRLATLLSRRAMTVSELAAMSQQPEQRCQVFVQLLQSFTLVDVQVSDPGTAPIAPSSKPTPLEVTAVGKPMPANAPKWALVRSIRQRLGL